MTEICLFSGTANRPLARAVARALHVPIALSETVRFPDGETAVRLLDPVRRKAVFVIQPTSPPVNDHLMELLAFADACRRASAAEITAVVPYFGYARADKRDGRREPISASLVAALLETIGVAHVVTLDLHAAQIEGFFHIPVDNLTAVPALSDALRDRLPAGTVVVSPDAGRLAMATEYAERLATSVVLLHKVRESGTKTHVTHLVGDVRGRRCLIVDDMIATGGTLAGCVRTLLEAGARPGLFVAATHALLLDGAREVLASDPIAEVFVTDTVAHDVARWPSLRVVSVADLIAGAIERAISDDAADRVPDAVLQER